MKPKEATHLIDQYSSGVEGPTVVLMGAIHGNEPAGVRAIQHVFQVLKAHQTPISGEIIGLIGNQKALDRDQRYIDVDLNRIWDNPDQKLCNAPHEKGEYFELHKKLVPLLEGPETVVLDLHTTSGKGAPFLLVGQNPSYREFLSRISLPIISGVIEKLKGTLVRFVQKKNHLALAIEGGQHHHPDTLKNLISLIWCVFNSLGVLKENHLTEEAFQYLEHKFSQLPGALELAYHHKVQPGHGFKMMPGYENFARVYAGETLAHDRFGPIPAPVSGYLLMPLYQGQGEDGFFIAR